MNCKNCGKKLEEDEKNYCKECLLEMDDFASNIKYSPFNPGL
jgi:predicted amidophosphoribosyltransferase